MRGVGTVTSRLMFPRQWFITALRDTRGLRQSWLRFPKRCDAAHNRDRLRGTLCLLMLVSSIF
jgi:hypothetical protein